MGLEGGSAVANSVPDCLSFAKARTVLGKKNTENPSKKAPTSVQNGTLEAPGSPPGTTLKKVPIPGAIPSSFLEPFLEPGVDFWGTIFFDMFWHPPRTTFYDFGAQKASKMEAFGAQFADFFENAKTSIFETLQTV